MNSNPNRNVIKITHSNVNINNVIKVIPVNEYTKKHNKQLFIKFVKPVDNQLDILQFMDDSTSNYKFSDKPIFLQQIINKKPSKNSNEPEFGQGSSFKRPHKSNRIEADVPTTYTITIDKAKAQKKFKTVPQEMNANSQYLILVRKTDTLFEAYPIENWYKIHPFSKLDIGSIEENERELLRKGQVSDMSSKKVLDRYKVEENESVKREIKDEFEEGLSDSEIQEREVLKKRKKEAVFQRVRHGQGDAHAGESDVDDHQGDEVDYMSDSSCDEDVLSEEEKDKLYDAVDVNQETVLRNEIEELSDQSDQEDEKKTEKPENDVSVIEDDDDEDDDDDDDDDESDESDSDDEKFRNKSKIDFATSLVTGSLKRANSDNNSNFSTEPKKPKFVNPKISEIIEELRKHLYRKPLSAKDLFKILLKKNLLENKDESKNLFMDCLNRLQAKVEVVQNIKLYSL